MAKKNAPRRYGGRLLDAARDELGLVEVVQHGERRSLHFGSAIEQSSHVPDAPDWLQFDYTRLLLLATAFPEVVDDVLLLGLGAGTVARYLLRHRDDSLRLDAVEYREAVADMAYRHFDLPVDSRLSVYIAWAGQFLETFEQPRDVILVDLYDAEGMNEEPGRVAFLDRCRDRLGSDGVMAINLWRTDPAEYEHMLVQLDRAFSGRILLAHADEANTVAYCFAEALPDLGSPGVEERVRERAKALAFDPAEFLAGIRPFSTERKI